MNDTTDLSPQSAQNVFQMQEQIRTLTTMLNEAEAMLAVKPSAMEYADQTLRIQELEYELGDRRMRDTANDTPATERVIGWCKTIAQKMGSTMDAHVLLQKVPEALRDLTEQLEKAKKERDRWENAEVKAKCDWADDHEAQTLRITELEDECFEMSAGCAEADELRPIVKRLTVELAQHQWHRVEDGLPTEKRPIEVAFPPSGAPFHEGEWKLSHWRFPAHRDWPMSSFTSQGATHWRYSTPPETSE